MPPKGYAGNETGFIKWTTKEEFNLLCSGLERWEHNYLTIFHITYYMGLRISEVVELKYTDILSNGMLRFRQRTKKAGNPYEIRERLIPDKVKEILDCYIFIQKIFRTNNYLFEPRASSGSKNPHLKANSVRWRMKLIRERLGLDDIYHIRKDGKKLARITPHTFRHAFITNFHKNSKDLVLTQRVIGHKKAETTARYIFVDQFRELERKYINQIE